METEMTNDEKAFTSWYSEDYAKIIWEEFNGNEIVEHTWLEACRYKQKENTELVMKLQSRIESLIAENAKLFEEAKKELSYKDKKIAYLEAECERVYHPIREFWNQEKDEEHKKTKEELNLSNQILWEIVDAWYEGNAFGQKMYHIGTIITDKHYTYLKKFIGRKNDTN